ncbi:hypothetical protein ACHAQJ_000137 [Trichoderma viride]
MSRFLMRKDSTCRFEDCKGIIEDLTSDPSLRSCSTRKFSVHRRYPALDDGQLHTTTTPAAATTEPDVAPKAEETATTMTQHNKSEGAEDKEETGPSKTEDSSMSGFISGAFAVLVGAVLANAIQRGAR